MLIQVAGVAALAIATTSFTASFIFLGLCKRVEASWRGDTPAEGEAKLDRRRVRYAMVSIFGSITAAILALTLELAPEASQSFNVTVWCISAAGLSITAARVAVHNRRGDLAPFNRRRGRT